MRTRVAMVACRGPHTTPWMNPQGGETGVRILHLEPGGEVVLIEDGSANEVAYSEVGEYPFRPKARFQIRKTPPTGEKGFPTLVEVLYDG